MNVLDSKLLSLLLATAALVLSAVLRAFGY